MNDNKNYKVTAKAEDFEGWESPVSEIMGEVVHKIERDVENNLISTVSQTLGFNVDKDELIKALNYDRDQYNKGYKAAKRKYEEMNCVQFFISQYFDGTLEIECKHMHYTFVDGLHFDKVPKEELFCRMAEIQERCEGLGIIPRFVIM